MPHQARGAVGVLLDLHDVLERRIGRLVRVEQEVGRHHDGGEHVVEVVRDAAGELADQCPSSALGDLVLELALLGGLERIDDRGLLVALLLLDRGDVEARRSARRSPAERRVDRRDVALARAPPRAIAASSAARSRSATTARIERLGSPLALEQRSWNSRANSALVRTMPPVWSTVAIAIGVWWKKRMKRTSAARCGSVPSSRARLSTSVREAPGVPSAPKASLWKRRTGSVRPLRVLRSRSSTSVFTLARRAAQRRQQRRAIAGDEVGKLEAARADLGQILIEPIGERRVEIDDVAARHRPRRSRPARDRDSRSRAAAPERRSPAARARGSRR